MTHLSPDGGAVSPPSTLSRRDRPTVIRAPGFTAPVQRPDAADLQIASRRARLAELEAEMIAACEAAALGTRSRTRATAERKHWDRTTWHRYLAAAMRLEATYGPRMRRLRQEIGQLERLMTLPIAA